MSVAEAHVPPQNLEAEESVLGALMVSQAAFNPVFVDVRLRAEDFYRERHRIIFNAVKRLDDRSEPIDALTVTEHLRQTGELEEAGGPDSVAELASTVPAPGNAGHYARIVQQNALLRKLLTASHKITQSVHGREGEPRKVSERDWAKVLKVCNEIESAPLWIDESSDLGMLDLRAKARRLHAQEKANGNGGLGLIILDYIQLMRAEDMRANRVEQVGQMSRGLKILARELKVPVIALSQLSRAPEQRTGRDKRPILSDLRESGNLEKDADLVGFIYREDYYKNFGDDEVDEEERASLEGIAELIVRKNRNGPIDTVKL